MDPTSVRRIRVAPAAAAEGILALEGGVVGKSGEEFVGGDLSASLAVRVLLRAPLKVLGWSSRESLIPLVSTRRIINFQSISTTLSPS